MIVKILGSGQDAGIPQIGCPCDICTKARKHPAYRRYGPSIAFSSDKGWYLIDASPDISHQVEMLFGHDFPVRGILLTHAHFGHCAGLWYLGKESANVHDLPIYCTPAMKQFLSNNHPFNLLVKRGNIRLENLASHDLGACTPLRVPHRNEIADCVGFILTARKRLLYIPDVDCWTDDLIGEIGRSDIALLDGTFYSKDELPRFAEVPHPPIKESIDRLKNLDTTIYFTHINHTNPVNRDGVEREHVKNSGFQIAHDGMVLEI
ncbi:MAG: MBL fold metallo-hydrolase [Euryarchaeota archaeon]|nr:MBL fold metallo-hydrolase [Euryarchaeota archaeon]